MNQASKSKSMVRYSLAGALIGGFISEVFGGSWIAGSIIGCAIALTISFSDEFGGVGATIYLICTFGIGGALIGGFIGEVLVGSWIAGSTIGYFAFVMMWYHFPDGDDAGAVVLLLSICLGILGMIVGWMLSKILGSMISDDELSLVGWSIGFFSGIIINIWLDNYHQTNPHGNEDFDYEDNRGEYEEWGYESDTDADMGDDPSFESKIVR